MQVFNQRKLVLTGGGTAGHVIPNLVLIEGIKKVSPNADITYIGSNKGFERDLIADLDLSIRFESVATGKLRRYFSFENFADLAKVFFGFSQALVLLRKIKPAFVFNKGGYVGVPVCFAAWALGIPVIIHESDSSMGLANRLVAKIAKRVVVSHPLLQEKLKNDAQVTSLPLPIRFSLTQGDRARALKELNLTDRATILVMGGSQGSKFVNELIWKALPELLKTHNVIHISGKGEVPKSAKGLYSKGYRNFTYVKDELPDYYSLADLLIGRAGATALAEWSIFEKPAILIPLAKDKSRGEQIINARYFLKTNKGKLIYEKDITATGLITEVMELALKESERIPQNKAALAVKQQEVVELYLNEFKQYL